MKLLQLTIFVAVLFSNIHYEWTPNGYLASILAVGAAFVVTVVIDRLRTRQQFRSRHERLQ